MALILTGRFGLEIYDDRNVLECLHCFRNGITATAINDSFNTYFRNGTPAAAWYIGLIDNSGFTAVNDETDTMASHAGWTEINAEYDEATRPAWAPDAAASQTIANSLKATFTFNAAKTIKGMFVATDNTKGGTTGVLWCTGVLDVLQDMQPGKTAKAYYTLDGQEG